MYSVENRSNPDRPDSYEQYLVERGGALQAEDLFHYINSDLFVVSNKLHSIKEGLIRSEIPARDKHQMLELINEVNNGHNHLQRIVRDSLDVLAQFQRQ